MIYTATVFTLSFYLFIFKYWLYPGIVVHACYPAFRRLRQEAHKSEASLGYIENSRLA
jgi:hypothetical protein